MTNPDHDANASFIRRHAVGFVGSATVLTVVVGLSIGAIVGEITHDFLWGATALFISGIAFIFVGIGIILLSGGRNTLRSVRNAARSHGK